MHLVIIADSAVHLKQFVPLKGMLTIITICINILYIRLQYPTDHIGYLCMDYYNLIGHRSEFLIPYLELRGNSYIY
jgi:hypothetical protein